MGRNFSIRTILLATFLLVAMLTPAFAYISYDNVQQTSEESQQLIMHTNNIAELGQQSVEDSDNIVQNFENIRDYQQSGDQSAAEQETDELADNFRQFVIDTNQLVSHMEQSEANFTEEKERIRASQDEMETLIQYTTSSVQHGTTLGSFVIDDSQEQLNRVSRTSTEVSARVVDEETAELIALNENLETLSFSILFAGTLTVLVGLGFALGLSVLISRPVRELENEAEKIKREEFSDVNLEKVDTRISEFNELKEMMENVVIALKSEFEREREGMNDLALDMVSILSEEIPRGVAESSLSSAAERAGVSPVEITEKDAEKIIKNLEISTRGLGVDDRTFEKMRERINQ